MDSKKILLVEDEGIVAKDLQMRLHTLGYEVCGWFTSGEEALAQGPGLAPDLVLMDIHLKGKMDGIEAAERLRTSHGIPIVFLTAHADESTIERAKIASPLGYILKPFDESDLHVSVEMAFYKHGVDRLLQEREQWLSTTLKSIADAVIATDASGRVTYLNPVAERLTGWECQEAIGSRLTNVFSLSGEEIPGSSGDPVAQVLRDGAPAELARHGLLVCKDGAAAHVEGIAAPLRDGERDATGAVLVFRDVSERRKAEALLTSVMEDLKRANSDLADQKGLLTALFDASPSAVMVVDGQRNVQMINQTLQRAFSVSERTKGQQFPGDFLRCPEALGSPGACGSMEVCQACKLRMLVADALAGKDSSRQRAEFVTMDKGRAKRLVLLASAVPLDFKGSRLAILILEDVTELASLRKILKPDQSFAGIVGRDPKMAEIYETIRELAEVTAPVLILGESGTGKELVAQAIHSQGPRAAKSFVAVNCGALPDGLIESELFGHEKGSFTGAIRDKKGRFELARGGTIFLDEVGDLSPAMQVKLLRVLEAKAFERVGGEQTIKVDARVISATNKDLEAAVKAGTFREDLFYRLSVVPIHIPPLRDRIHDVPLLAEFILERSAALSGRPLGTLAPEALAALMEWHWPGNVRELQNAIEFALIKAKGQMILPEHLPLAHRTASIHPRPVTRKRKKLDGAAVRAALAAAGGDKAEAARALGISRATMYRLVRKLPGEAADP